jgi:hypothetical protein
MLVGVRKHEHFNMEYQDQVLVSPLRQAPLFAELRTAVHGCLGRLNGTGTDGVGCYMTPAFWGGLGHLDRLPLRLC